MKKTILLTIPFLLASCGGVENENSSSANPEVEEITINDGIGRENTYLPGSYKRIVCVGAGALRLYSYIGDNSLLVGVEDIDNPAKRENGGFAFEGVARPYYDANKESYRNLLSVGAGGPVANQSGPNLSALVNATPDLIISDFETAEAAKSMEDATGAKVFTIKYGRAAIYDNTVTDVLTSLGKVLKKEERAKEIKDFVTSSINEIKDKTKDVKDEDKPLVYVGGIGNWGQKNYLATHSNYPMFNVANIKNALTEITLTAQGQQDISKAAFEELAPKMDKMIIDAAGMKQTIDAYNADRTIFDNVKAVQNGEVYLQLPYNAYYTNLEVSLMDGYFDAAVTYPELFKDFDLEAKYREILTKFVGKDIYDTEIAMSGSFGGYQKISNLKTWCEERIK